jgi:hypothetical protein
VNEVQSVLKRADPNNAEHAESWSEELLDIFQAQSSDDQGGVLVIFDE